ncbi:MAG: hypothetical protein IJD63_00790 [Oscillospiraceae bacterium]|nr:hypothetical protein [Oscillospiraceae bacterium]
MSKNVFLRLVCLLCAMVMVVGLLAACGGDQEDPTNPPAGPTDGPTDPTDGSNDPTDGTENPTDGPENPTDAPSGGEDDPNSSIMDGDDHIEIDW